MAGSHPPDMLVLREGLSPVCFVILSCLCCLPDCSRDRPKGAVHTWMSSHLPGFRFSCWRDQHGFQGWFPDSDCEAWVHGEVTTGECPKREGGLGRDRASRSSTAETHRRGAHVEAIHTCRHTRRVMFSSSAHSDLCHWRCISCL